MNTNVLCQLTTEQLVQLIIGAFHTNISWGYKHPIHGVIMTYQDQYGKIDIDVRKLHELNTPCLLEIYQDVVGE
ncbi:hypothetical protein VPHD479_0298 [Vibrio phage D479]